MNYLIEQTWRPMTSKVSSRRAQMVRKRADHRCEYCLASEWLMGQLCHIDHIVPRAKDGSSKLDNLCLACAACNGSKLDRTHAFDPETGELVRLFHPREQEWYEHFAWSSDGTHILGITACGRATVELLRLNRPLSVAVRAHWVSIHRHPPHRNH